MTLIAELEKLQITQYDATTFDRYYYAFDTEVASAELSDATVEIIPPGTTATSGGAFVDGIASEFTFENGGILITIGEGTDLTNITENGGSLTVDF